MFVQRRIDAKFILGKGTFGNSGNDTLTLTGFDNTKPGPRISVQIDHAGGAYGSGLQMKVWGMTLSQMNQLSTLGVVFSVTQRNSIIVTAGDAGGGMEQIFVGTILHSGFDGANAPDVSFNVTAKAGYLNQVAPAGATSFNGSVDLTTALQRIGSQFTADDGSSGITVSNSHSSILSYPYFAGSPLKQALAAISHAGGVWNGLDDGTLTVWSPGAARQNVNTINFGADSGMVGYPAYNPNGLTFQSLFMPGLRLGSPITISSILFGAGSQNKVQSWNINSLSYDLEANMPGGKWFSMITAVPKGTLTIPSQF